MADSNEVYRCSANIKKIELFGDPRCVACGANYHACCAERLKKLNYLMSMRLTAVL